VPIISTLKAQYQEGVIALTTGNAPKQSRKLGDVQV